MMEGFIVCPRRIRVYDEVGVHESYFKSRTDQEALPSSDYTTVILPEIHAQVVQGELKAAFIRQFQDIADKGYYVSRIRITHTLKHRRWKERGFKISIVYSNMILHKKGDMYGSLFSVVFVKAGDDIKVTDVDLVRKVPEDLMMMDGHDV